MAIDLKKLRELAAVEAAKAKGGKRKQAPPPTNEGSAKEAPSSEEAAAAPAKERAVIAVMANPLAAASAKARERLAGRK